MREVRLEQFSRNHNLSSGYVQNTNNGIAIAYNKNRNGNQRHTAGRWSTYCYLLNLIRVGRPVLLEGEHKNCRFSREMCRKINLTNFSWHIYQTRWYRCLISAYFQKSGPLNRCNVSTECRNLFRLWARYPATASTIAIFFIFLPCHVLRMEE